MTKEARQKTLVNFKKAQSLIKKIVEMTEEEKYCIDIMQQNLAVIGLLKSAHETLMEGHLNSCFAMAMKTNNIERQQKMVNEILKVVKYSNR